MQLTQSFSWYDYPFNCICYFMASTADHIMVFAVCCLILFLVSLCLHIPYGRLFKPWGIVSIILFLVSVLLGGLWDCLIYSRFYVTADYVSDFSPFVPITQSVIDVHFDDYNDHLIGVTLGQLQLLWFLFAFTAWLLAAGVYLRGWKSSTLWTRACQRISSI